MDLVVLVLDWDDLDLLCSTILLEQSVATVLAHHLSQTDDHQIQPVHKHLQISNISDCYCSLACNNLDQGNHL